MDVITQGTDSTITMVFDSSELDVSKLNSVEIYLQQGNTVLVKTLNDVSVDVDAIVTQDSSIRYVLCYLLQKVSLESFLLVL